MLEHVKTIQALLANEKGMDIIIISTSSIQQQRYWQKRFATLHRHLFKPTAIVLTVLEDWNGGAGNGLGTFYAFLQARKLAREQHGIDLDEEIHKGKSAAIYHTSGYGQRLAPLTISELNNKSSIRLPSLLTQEGELLTILEAVIKQTSLYSDLGKGRLSVFWGDQVFIPSRLPQGSPKSHVEIFGKFSPSTGKEEWHTKGLHNYGLIAKAKEEDHKRPHTQVVDKVNYEQYLDLVEQKKISVEGGIGTSLGCFTISYVALEGLLKAFSSELQERQGRMDMDPHIWMPATLDKECYLAFMDRLKVSADDAAKHYDRIGKFLSMIKEIDPNKNFFGSHDIGAESYWWDYGTTANYWINNRKLLQNNAEAECMKAFYNIYASDRIGQNEIDPQSVCLHCRIEHGRVKNSVLVNVDAQHVDFENCLVINTTVLDATLKNGLLYNVLDNKPLKLSEGAIRADFYQETKGLTPLNTSFSRDSKLDWNQRLPNNACSYKEAYESNAKANQDEIRTKFKELQHHLQEELHAIKH